MIRDLLRHLTFCVVMGGLIAGVGGNLSAQEGGTQPSAGEEAARLLAEHKYSEAADILEKLHAANPDDKRLLFDCVASLAWAERYKEAAGISKDFLRLNPPMYALAAAAQAQRNVGDFDLAIALYRDGENRYADNSDFMNGHILCLTDAGRYDEAEALMKTYLERFGSTREYSATERYERDSRASAEFNRRRAAAVALARAGKYDEALTELNKLKGERPNLVSVDYDIMTILSWAGRQKEAAVRAGSLDLDKSPAYAREAAAVAYRETGELAKAEALYRGLVAADPKNVDLVEGLALTLVKQGRGKEAAAFVEKTLPRREAPLALVEDAIVAEKRAEAVNLARSGKFGMAIGILEDLRDRYPLASGLVEDELTVLSWAGRFEEATALAAKIDTAHAPDYALAALASSYRKQNRLPEALSAYESARERFPDSVDLAAGAAMTMGDLGNPEGGMKLLDDFAARHPAADLKEIDDARQYLNPPPPYAPPPRPETSYRREQDAILDMGRTGNLETALLAMSDLFRAHPADQYLLGDYIILLNWSREHEAVLKLAPRLELPLARSDVITTAGKSLFASGFFFEGQRFLEKAIAAQKGNTELVVAAAVVMAKGGIVDAAARWFREAARSRTPGAENLVAQGLKESHYEVVLFVRDSPGADAAGQPAGDAWIDAVRVFGIQSATGGHEARLERAVPDASPYPGITRLRAWNVKVAAGRQSAGWGERSELPRDVNERSRHLLDALAAMDSLRSEPDCQASTECRVLAGAVKVKAFYELGLFCEAITEYESIRDAGVRIPDGPLLAAAGAYLGARYPAKARDLYREFLARRNEPEPPIREDVYAGRDGLFWSLLENEELECALAETDRHYREGTGEGMDRALYFDEEYFKTDVGTTRGLAYLYTGFLAKAEEQLKEIVAEAPANVDALSALSTTYFMRDQPRTSNVVARRGLFFSPSDIGITAQMGDSYLEYQDWRNAHKMLRAAQPYILNDDTTRKLQRDWDIYNLYEFRLDVGWSRTFRGEDPGISGPGEYPTVEARIFSRPMAYDWRAFVGGAVGGGNFEEGRARQEIVLGGVEYRGPFATATLELRADHVENTKFGLGFSGEITPDDHWTIPFAFELCSRETPLRARYNGISANLLGTGLSYAWNESRSFNSTVTGMKFSDGNRRLEIGGDYNHRLWTCYNHYVDGQINAYATWNSQDADRPYFNPKNDQEVGVALTYGNILWRRYECSLSHAVTAGAAAYHQKYFGTKPVWSATYSQTLEMTKRFSATYGVGYASEMYDGGRTQSVNAFLSMVLRF